jgi:hypothetical protein
VVAQFGGLESLVLKLESKMGLIFKTRSKTKIKKFIFEKPNLKLDSQIHLCVELGIEIFDF